MNTLPKEDPKSGKFQKGTVPNPAGRTPIAFSVTSIIRARIMERPLVVDKLFEAIENGEAWAIQYAINRLDGMPRQATEVSLPDGPLTTVFVSVPDAPS